SMLSCGGGGGGAQLDGTWTLITTPDNPPLAVGDGPYTVTFSWYYEQEDIEYYAGSGIIGEEDYKISISKKFQTDQDGYNYYLFLYKEGESIDENSIKCYGILSGTTSASGQYEGQGTYENYGTGTFNTMKQ
ncbi:MAG: hypothetical protein KAS61_09160, partial [Spirochaetes bacterium]|nr:hypothetical protein [Spirochaetota bacterium]